MVKSKSSCLRIIACGSDSAEIGDLKRTDQTKASTDKRGWNFRKRSATHRVLRNTVISEVQSTGHKDGPQAVATDFNALTNPTVPEKTSVSQWKDETIESISSDAVNSKVADTLLVRGVGNGDHTVQESVAIVIQSAIRIYLAKKALCKLKNVVKLQAAVRGHLVRRQAVGTLRCVQAIVKMQAIVRARRTRLSLEGLSIQERHGRELKTDKGRLNHLVYSGTDTNETNASMKKLLASGFARQLLHSKPKTKPIHINCDPAKPESAWKWLERWMSVSSLDFMQPQKLQINPDHHEKGIKNSSTASEIGTVGTAEVISDYTAMKTDIKGTEMLLEAEENLNTNSADGFDFQACEAMAISGEASSYAVETGLEDGCLRIPEGTSTKHREAHRDTIDSVLNQVDAHSSSMLQTKLSTTSDKPEVSNENSKRTVKRVASEQLGNEGKKFTFGSRKSTNPSFAAVKSKFEELSSTATSGRSISSGYRDAAVESRLDSSPSWAGSVSKDKDLGMSEELVSHDPRIQMWGSECGTELSITSTLDSPDKTEVEGGEFVHEIRSMDKESSDKFNLKNPDADANNSSSMLESVPNSSYPGYVQPGKLQEGHGNSADSSSPVCASNVHHPSEQIVSDMQAQMNTATDPHVGSLSPGGSPRSHITVPDSHGTPSSQISHTSMRNKSDNSLPRQKHSSQSAGKRSISKQSQESSVRNSTEHLPMDSKSGKGRNSLDHESRVTGSNSLPSYMQATESAKAKAQMNHSPKPSPDVQDKDSYLKKRHSLPVTNGKQGSPQMQRSNSQAQQNVKGNGTHSPQIAAERKWQR
ncbi:hypothetical protein MRB53_018932 [Persea americana]|uniref:Uncharacterized protein n=1 Tax=Persea americana TaxID=3435 RepID=A0ACC2M9Z2_PERAE|nr:hypothetical protein MRB53_018932 [Persea americana]|eukprot:TRINITY_DN2609_c0_g2_i1.p1 TRINITY_DN2609_c0_g2~~TRINITY_DN2609_c0_g2_i1.p1  ORF type:complete len:814 (-),score=176.92 TRINITY_DN2609_c0_g2_i1:634-3075(-)